MIKTSGLPELGLAKEEDRAAMLACTSAAWAAMYPSPDVQLMTGAAERKGLEHFIFIKIKKIKTSELLKQNDL